MLNSSSQIAAARRVELIILRLNSLSTTPAVATQYFSLLFGPPMDSAALSELIETDAALTAKFLSLMSTEGLKIDSGLPIIEQIVSKLPANIVQDAILSINIIQNQSNNRHGSVHRNQLALHSLAVACCAKSLAQTGPCKDIDPYMAFTAGLLHDIGKLALDEVMPKSFDRITVKSKDEGKSSSEIEQELLGIDHAILGKRLAQKWNLPGEITSSIWLHHSGTDTIAATLPAAKPAQVVKLAGMIAGESQIGESGSYNCVKTESIHEIAESLGIDSETIGRIQQELPAAVEQKAEILGINKHETTSDYCRVIHSAVIKLAKDNAKLTGYNRQLGSDASYLDFINDFIQSLNNNHEAIDVASNFAKRWQRFYETGKVCIYLDTPSGIEAVTVDNSSQTEIVLVEEPKDSPLIPTKVQNDFEIINAFDDANWLFDQLEVDFDPNRTKLVPLLSDGNAIGAVIFEVSYPVDSEQVRDKLAATIAVGGNIIALAIAMEQQQRYAERFAQLLVQLTQAQKQISSTKLLEGLAEIAAGAAHELNNPLVVISGRAQLLSETETYPDKKKMLKQISEKANEVTEIVEELLNFAKPQPPKPAEVTVKALVNQAISQTVRNLDIEGIEVYLEGLEETKKVFIDPSQITTALCNVITNGLESYPDGTGPINITAAASENADTVKIQISDKGCGMDAQTLEKASQPFFSAKEAGRKRGMGLANTKRILLLNNCTLQIESIQTSGTKVTVTLPCV